MNLTKGERQTPDRFAIFLVAESGGGVIGGAAGASLDLPGLQVSEQEITRRIGLLDILAVRPAHRRKGLGALLASIVLDQFRDAGCRTMVYLAPRRHDLRAL